MKKALLFDLGNTLVRYFERSEFAAILEQSILEVRRHLQQQGLLAVSTETMWHRVREEDHEAQDHRVRPLEGRLGRIFEIDAAQSPAVVGTMCRRFTQPIFARGRCYEDALPVLRQLRAEGVRTAIVSNTPWGSPGALWREELARLGLSAWVDAAVFCTDVGWRKPARPILERALGILGVDPQDCLFVGDDPRWDLAGPRAVGMEAILIDRKGGISEPAEGSIRHLHELWGALPRR
jgi:putative hydrolase of the HAD superfamily